MIKKIVKTLFGIFFLYSGWYYLIKKYNQKNTKIPIIMYHSIRNRDETIPTCLDLIGMTVSKRNFQKQIKHLSERYRVLTITELIEAKKRGRLNDLENVVVITFDDGFYDNYAFAVPILKKYDLKATIFLIGNATISGELIWQHKMYQIIDNIYSNELRISHKNIKDVIRHKIKVVDRIRKFASKLKSCEKMVYIKELQSAYFSEEKSTKSYLPEAVIKKLVKDGYDFGAHSMNHFDMIDLKDGAVADEIRLSKNTIERVTGKRCISFAYPRGGKGTYDLRTIKELKNNSYYCALNTVEGLADLESDVYELNRIEIRDFNQYEFILHITGVIGAIKKTVKKMLRC